MVAGKGDDNMRKHSFILLVTYLLALLYCLVRLPFLPQEGVNKIVVFVTTVSSFLIVGDFCFSWYDLFDKLMKKQQQLLDTVIECQKVAATSSWDSRNDDIFQKLVGVNSKDYFDQLEIDVNADLVKFREKFNTYKKIQYLGIGFTVMAFLAGWIVLFEERLWRELVIYQPLLTIASFILVILVYITKEYADKLFHKLSIHIRNAKIYLSYKKHLGTISYLYREMDMIDHID